MGNTFISMWNSEPVVSRLLLLERNKNKIKLGLFRQHSFDIFIFFKVKNKSKQLSSFINIFWLYKEHFNNKHKLQKMNIFYLKFTKLSLFLIPPNTEENLRVFQ